MRAPKPLGALLAGSFFALAKAQASAYGNAEGNGLPAPSEKPDGSPPSGNGVPLPSGNPGQWQTPNNGIPGSLENPANEQSPDGYGKSPSSGRQGVPPYPDGSSSWPNDNDSPSVTGFPGEWQNPAGSNAPIPSGIVPGDWPNDPECEVHGVTTVYVTVAPSAVIDPIPADVSRPSGPVDTSPVDAGNGVPSSGPWSGDNGTPGDAPSHEAPPYGSADGSSGASSSAEPSSSGTLPNGSLPGGQAPPADQEGNGQGVPPTQTSQSAEQGSSAPVKPFTTITIDIWGTGDAPVTVASDASPQVTSADSGIVTDGSGPAPSAPVDPNNGHPSNEPGTAPSPNPAESPAQVSGAGSYGNPDDSPVFVTHGKPGPSGVEQKPPASPQMTSPSDGASSPSEGSGNVGGSRPQDGDAPYSLTIIGEDGQPTIVSHPWGHDGQSGGQPVQPDVYASSADAQAIPVPVSSTASASPPSVTSGPAPGGFDGSDIDSSAVTTCVTIIGADGKPTVLDFTAPNPSATTGSGPGTAITDGSALAQSLTIVGADGKPTVVTSPWGNAGIPSNPGPVVTAVPGPGGSGNDSGNVGGGTISSGILPSGSVTTCVTVLGSDGKPTVVDWPFTGIPASHGPIFTTAPGSGNGHDGSITRVAPVSDAATCVTILGPDGRPTVVDWPLTSISSGLGPVSTSADFPGDGSHDTGDALTDGSALPMTHASFTILGPDGLPTVVESSWAFSPTDAGPGPDQGPAVSQASISDLPSGISAQLPLPSGEPPQGVSGAGSISITCYTLIGQDGKPTVVETTLSVPEATGGPVIGPGATLLPPPISSALSLPILSSLDIVSGGTVDRSGNGPVDGPRTTCTSYTILGPDGLPTVIDTTWVVPPAFETGSALATDASAPASAPAGQITGVPTSPKPQGGDLAVTTCSTYTIIGPDGLPTAVESTFVVPVQASSALATDSRLTSGVQDAPWPAIPTDPAPPSANGNGVSGSDGSAGNGPLTTCITVMTTGSDGILTPVEQTVTFPPASGPGLPSIITDQSALPLTTAGLPESFPSVPVVDNGGSRPGNGGNPDISGYDGHASGDDSGTVAPPNGPIVTGGSIDPVTAGGPTITVTGTRTYTSLIVADPSGGPVTSGPSGIPLSDYAAGGAGEHFPATALPPGEGTVVDPTESTLFPTGTVAYGGAEAGGIPVTSTWSHSIPAGTTTHLLRFPLTTLATLPLKRILKRQATGNSSTSAVENTSLAASLSSIAGAGQTASSVLPTITSASASSARPAPSMCVTGGNIGNRTVNFDSEKAGPLFNPSSDLWFSEGFLIAPPSSQAEQPYFASSGGQLVEFVPAALTPNRDGEGSDVAEIGVGPNASKECYHFDLFGASLGCAAEGAEQWCEFEISAYRWNAETSQEESIAWSETKRVPACANFPDGPCGLTPVNLDGYTDITGVLITLRVGLEHRAWWGDDFRYGWTDNSCEAAACRSGAAAHRVKREVVETALRRGVWHWTPNGVERLDDDFIWDAVQ